MFIFRLLMWLNVFEQLLVWLAVELFRILEEANFQVTITFRRIKLWKKFG